MLGGLAKANTWVAKPRVPSLSYPFPSTGSGAWLNANLRVIRPTGTIPNEYEASCRYEHVWSERSPDLSSMLPPRAPTSHKPPHRAV
jgi:hypothetical protein